MLNAEVGIRNDDRCGGTGGTEKSVGGGMRAAEKRIAIYEPL